MKFCFDWLIETCFATSHAKKKIKIKNKIEMEKEKTSKPSKIFPVHVVTIHMLVHVVKFVNRQLILNHVLHEANQHIGSHG